jgi:RHS repeat-associated protein
VRRRRFPLFVEPLEDRILLSTVTWINLNGGDWDTASNWQDQSGVNRVPGPSDDAVINVAASPTITHAQGVTDTVQSLTAADPFILSSGTLNITGTLSTSSSFQITGGTLGMATVQTGTTITATGGGGESLNNITLAGTVVAAQAVLFATGGLTMESGSLIQVGDAGHTGSIQFSGDQTVGGTGEFRFVGEGGGFNIFDNLTLAPGITIHGTNGTLFNVTGSLTNQGTISSDSSGAISLNGNPGTSATNAASGTLAAAGGTLNLGFINSDNYQWSNAGQILVQPNSTLNLGARFTTAGLGAYTNNGGTINLTGTLNNTGATLALNSGTGSWFLAGGTVDGGTVATADGTALIAGGGTLQGVTLGGTVNGNAEPGTLTDPTGGITVNGGLTLVNNTVIQVGDASHSGFIQFGSDQSVGGTGEFRFVGEGGGFNIFDNLTLAPGITIHGTNGFFFNVTGSLTNQGTIASDSGGTFSFTGNGGTFFANAAGGTLEANGGTLELATSWSNAGQILVQANSTLNLGGSFTTAGLGNYTNNGGSINLIRGTLDNTGATLALNATTGSWTVSGTINGGTVVTADGTALIAGGGTLQGVTLGGTVNGNAEPGTLTVITRGIFVNGGLTLANNTVVQVGDPSHSGDIEVSGDQTVGGIGEFQFVGVGGGFRILSGTLTLGSGITLHGLNTPLNQFGLPTNFVNISLIGGNLANQANFEMDGGNNLTISGNSGTSWTNAAGATLTAVGNSTISLGDSWSNAGQIAVTNSTLNLSGSWTNSGPIAPTGSTVNLAGSWTNSGTISQVNSTINLGGAFKTSGLGTISSTNGTVNITGTLNNDVPLALTNATGSFDLNGGTINGGTVTTSGTVELIAGLNGGTLNAVTLGATLDASQFLSPLTVINGLTMNNGTIKLEGNNSLSFAGSQTLGGTGTVSLFRQVGQNGLRVPNSGDTLTIAPGILIHGDGFVGSSTGGAVTNEGTITSDDGRSVTVQGATNFASGTLTAGTWQVSGSSTLRLIGDNISTDAATLLLDGAGAQIFSDTGTTNALAGLAAVTTAGSFTVQNGANVNVAASAFTNAGMVVVGSGSTLTTAGSYTQSSGSTAVNGTLASGGTVAVNGGVLNGAGTVQGNVVNAAQITPGNAPGVLMITGNYTQTSAGTLNIEIGGTTPGSGYDQLNISGTAALDGTLNISLINGFGPAFGQTFQIMSFASSSGTFATINGLTLGFKTLFTVSLGASSLVLNAIVNASDLAFESVTVPASGMPGQVVSIPYTVQNLAATPATGDWFDSLYLSSDAVFDSADTLLGRVHHVGDVAGNSSYSETLTAPVPALPNGNYHVIVLVDSRGLVPDLNRANNLGVSSGVINLSVPELPLGVPTAGTIADGQDEYFHLVLAPGADVTLTANFTVSPEAEFNERYAALPDRTNFDQTAANVADLRPQITLDNVQGGDYFILLHGREGAGNGGASFTLEAQAATFGISSFSPSEGSNQGQATISLVGAEFATQTAVSLVDAFNVSHPAGSVLFQDAQHLAATFDLAQLALGSYTLEAQDAGRVATASSVFQVIVGSPGHLSLVISTPAAVYVGMPIAMQVIATNSGDTDVPAPFIEVDATNVVASQMTEQFFGGGSNTLPGFLPPHFHGQVAGFIYDPEPHAEGVTSNFNLLAANPSTTLINWDSNMEMLRPPSVPDDAWAAIWQNLRPLLGNTLADLDILLQNDADALRQQGVFTNDVGRLLRFEISKANDEQPSPILAQVTDLAFPGPGLPLVFTRTFQSSVVGRYARGRLGRGWVDNFDISATTDSSGLVTIHEGPLSRFFAPLPDGTYIGPLGEFGSLTRVNGAFQLREPNGLLIAFRTDGSLDYVQDTNNNRITAGYTGSQLTSLTHSDGSALTLSYNAQGVLSQITDPTGRVVTYTYDASGQLASCTTTAGTTEYTYTPDASGPRAHSLASITNPDGTHRFFNYDSQGRLAQQQRDGGAATFSYTYDVASYRVTDAQGDMATFSFDDLGNIRNVQDPQGNLNVFRYDNAQNLVIVAARGSEASFNYDGAGNLTGAVDPLGNQQTSTYEPTFNNLTSWTDALGNATAYSYDGSGNLATATYADGSTQQDSYDAHGNRVRTVDRRGQLITNTFNNLGLLIEQQFPDGSHFDYSYDAHGNLMSATDASGTTSMQYDAAARLTQITYPNGRFLQFTYDAGGRRTQSVDQDGFTVNYSYDAAGRLATLTDGAGGLIVSYTYDSVGRLVRKDQGNGTSTTYAYDANSQVVDLINFAPGGSINSRFDYTYDNQGRRTSMTTLDGTTTYGYDADGRLTSVNLPGGRTITYAYDGNGNRTAVIDNGAATSYTTNNLNEYTSIGTGTQSYDAGGDVTGTSGSLGNASYTYDALGRLTGVTTATDSWTFEYDALGNRIATIHNGQRTEFLVDPAGLGNVEGEYDGSGRVIAHYTYGLGLTSQVGTGNIANYYDFDALGSTAGLSGPSGSYLNRYSYLPFGETLSASESVGNPFHYNGQLGVQDDGNGLNFMRLRYYDASQGRFIQPDPIALNGGPNFYTYAGNNPMSLVDPTGLYPFTPDESGVFRIGPSEPGEAPLGLPSGDPPGSGTFRIGSGNGEKVPEKLPEVTANDFERFGQNPDEPKPPVDPVVLPGLAFTAIVWSLGSIIYAQEYRLFTFRNGHLGNLPECPSFFKHSLNFITACDGAPIVGPSPTGNSKTVQVGGPVDPNFLSGPAGFGSAGYIRPEASLPYVIQFANEPSAETPAQQVVVTQHLDPNLDPSTFQVGDFGFGGQVFQIPADRQFYSTRIDERSTLGIFVDFTANFDQGTDTATWTFASIDPSTLDVPADPRVGFLPPDQTPPQGEGFVSYTIQPKATDTTATVINAQGSVVFNTNAPVATNTFTNTIDAGPPTSSVLPLPPTETSTSFTVSWSGQDDPGGSGIASFDIFVSDNGGPFTPFLTGTTQTSAIFDGQNGHTYGFYSVATDNVGHVEATPMAAEAQTTVVTIATPVFSDLSSPTIVYGTATTTLSGHLAAPTASPPAGENVSITVNNVTQTAMLDGSGNFSSTFQTGALGVPALPYTISYSYAGDANFSSATDNTKTLTVQQASPVFSNLSSPTIVYGTATTTLSGHLAAPTAIPTVNESVSITVNNVTQTAMLDGGGDFSSTFQTGVFGVPALPYTITYGYAGDANFSSAPDDTKTLTVQQASPVFSNLGAPTITFGTASTTIFGQLNANAGGQLVPAGEMVQVTLNGVTQGAMLAGSDSFATTFATGTLGVAGSPYTISFAYAGDANFNTASAASTLTVMPSTSTSVIGAPNPSTFGQTVTFTAAVSDTSGSGGTPTGSVQFQVDGNNFDAPVAVDATGHAATTDSALGVGSHTIAALYTPTGSFVRSQGSTTQTVNQASTATSVTSSANPSVFGQVVTFTATVSAVSPGVGIPTGTVAFKDGGATIGTGALNGSGQATFTVSALSVSGHSITAAYGGDANFAGSSSPASSQTVNKAATSTTVVSSVNPSVSDQPVTFTATVNVTAPGSGTPTGTVTFKDGSKVLGTSSLNSNRQATFTTSNLKVDNHSITAVYNGDASFAGSTSPVLVQIVNKKRGNDAAIIISPTLNLSGVTTSSKSGAATSISSRSTPLPTQALPGSDKVMVDYLFASGDYDAHNMIHGKQATSDWAEDWLDNLFDNQGVWVS